MKIITQREYAFFASFIDWFKNKTDTDLMADFKEFCAERIKIVVKDNTILDSRVILSAVSFELGISEVRILSKNRNRELVEARTIIARILLNEGNGTQSIGLFLGGRDHSTIVYAGQKHYDLMEFDIGYKAKFERVVKTLENNGMLISKINAT